MRSTKKNKKMRKRTVWLQEETSKDWRPQSRVNSLVNGERRGSATSPNGVTKGLSSTRKYMHVGVSYKGRGNTIHGLCCIRHWLHTKKEPTLVTQAEGRKISTKKQKRTSMNEGGREDCQPPWGTDLCLLDGDEDFVDDQPALKIMRQECADNDSYGLSSNNEDKYLEFGQHGGRLAWVSMGDTVLPMWGLR